jgi:hypothetical protein
MRLQRAPRDPVARFAATLAARAADLAQAGEFAFHDWAFHTLRQLGANYELLGDHLAWLDDGPAFAEARRACKSISGAAKTLQFQMARAVARARAADLSALLEEVGRARATTLDGIVSGLAQRAAG